MNFMFVYLVGGQLNVVNSLSVSMNRRVLHSHLENDTIRLY